MRIVPFGAGCYGNARIGTSSRVIAVLRVSGLCDVPGTGADRNRKTLIKGSVCGEGDPPKREEGRPGRSRVMGIIGSGVTCS